MRILAGKLKGRPLLAPAGNRTRPSSSRPRGAVFDILSHAEWRPDWQDTHVLDLFAGSGAMGIEALSRGATSCVCLDTDPQARQSIAANSEALGLCDRLSIFARDALAPGRLPPDRARCNLIFLDPPYSQNLVAPALTAMTRQGWLTDKALAIIECAVQLPPDLPAPWQVLCRRDYGRTRFLFAQNA